MLPGCIFAAGFSHKLHLQLKLTCVTCHASAASSTNIRDNNLPQPQVCAPCHTAQVPAIKKPRVTNLAKFSHRQHVAMGAAIAAALAKAVDTKQYLSDPGDMRRHLDTKDACAACHRGLGESDAVTAAAFPRMADCLVCHNKIQAPFSCETCHEANAGLKPVDHTPDFLDRHTTGKVIKDHASCAVCHGRRFTCLGCHQGG